MFWERFVSLCSSKNEKPNRTAAKIGVSSASVTKWKNGSIPNSDSLVKLSEYFCVSIDYLLGKSDKMLDESNITSEQQTQIDLIEFGEKLKNARNKKGFTQSELAEKTDVSVNTIKQLENGKMIPKIETITKFANQLGVSIVHLCGADYAISLISAKAIDISSMNAWDMMIMGEIKQEEIREVFFVNPMFIQHFFDNLNDEGKIEATKYVERLTRLEEYKKPDDIPEEASSKKEKTAD